MNERNEQQHGHKLESTVEGRQQITQFREFCQKQNQEPTAELLSNWDVQHNESRIRQGFKSQAEGNDLNTLYRNYLQANLSTEAAAAKA